MIRVAHGVHRPKGSFMASTAARLSQDNAIITSLDVAGGMGRRRACTAPQVRRRSAPS
jgi:hypothetical protein